MEENDDETPPYQDGSHKIVVPGFSNLSNKVLFCPRFGGLFVCSLGCGCTIAKGKRLPSHLRQMHPGECGIHAPGEPLVGANVLEHLCEDLAL